MLLTFQMAEVSYSHGAGALERLAVAWVKITSRTVYHLLNRSLGN